MKRRALLQFTLSAAAFFALACDRERQRAAARPGKQRLVSLSPAITETLFAIGAGPELVGVSDYCDYPEAAKKLPRTGTALSPGYEAIVRLEPSLILSEGANSAPRRELSALGVTKFLPWLSLEDIVASTRLLGALTSHSETAGELARKLWDGLAVAESANGPRVLLVLGETSGKLNEILFIKRNSIHGAVLRAAGARNAVASDVAGVPRLSFEELLRLDPDAIIVLARARPNAPSETQILHDYQALEPLTARKNGRISLLQSEAAFSNGPRILELAEALKRELSRLFPSPAPAPERP
ncbi:MAG TPA: helical backbone metal receptor [Polyangiaceae bacterium]|nr:helical backbone metal receptor [Polyangiaceae bacterium]